MIPYNVRFSHNTCVTDRQTDDGRDVVPKVRPNGRPKLAQTFSTARLIGLSIFSSREQKGHRSSVVKTSINDTHLVSMFTHLLGYWSLGGCIAAAGSSDVVR